MSVFKAKYFTLILTLKKGDPMGLPRIETYIRNRISHKFNPF